MSANKNCYMADMATLGRRWSGASLIVFADSPEDAARFANQEIRDARPASFGQNSNAEKQFKADDFELLDATTISSHLISN